MLNDDSRLQTLLDRIASAEKRVQLLTEKCQDDVSRVKRDLHSRGVFGARFVTVPSDYYDR